ncbi:MAG: hypothetical protein ABH858_01300 [Candidatus Omnitrophota bacterium]
MKVILGLCLEDGLLSFLFAANHKGKLIPITSSFLNIERGQDDLSEFIKAYIDDLDREIREKEKKLSFNVSHVFFRLSDQYANKKVVEDIVSFNTRKDEKRITYRDIIWAKKQLENISLECDDVCLHHLVMEYFLKAAVFNAAPIGLLARKIRLKSLIVFCRRSVYQNFGDCFDSIGCKFAGFVYDTLADYSLIYDANNKDVCAVVNIKLRETRASYFYGNSFIKEDFFGFGEKDVIEAVARKFSLSLDLASSLVFNYGSFKDVSHAKEICVKDEASYLNVSAMSLNDFLKDIVSRRLGQIINTIKVKINKSKLPVFFTGRLSRIDGFSDFVKNGLKLQLKETQVKKDIQAGYGALYYGITRFLELNVQPQSLFQRLFKVYKEYF